MPTGVKKKKNCLSATVPSVDVIVWKDSLNSCFFRSVIFYVATFNLCTVAYAHCGVYI